MARRGWVGEMSGLFEHPAWGNPLVLYVQASNIPACPESFFRSLLNREKYAHRDISSNVRQFRNVRQPYT